MQNADPVNMSIQIQKLQKDKQKTESSVGARQTKAQTEVKKCEANLAKAQQKHQTAEAKQVHLLSTDGRSRIVLALHVAAIRLPFMF